MLFFRVFSFKRSSDTEDTERTEDSYETANSFKLFICVLSVKETAF
jgi:hypothetical protein